MPLALYQQNRKGALRSRVDPQDWCLTKPTRRVAWLWGGPNRWSIHQVSATDTGNFTVHVIKFIPVHSKPHQIHSHSFFVFLITIHPNFSSPSVHLPHPRLEGALEVVAHPLRTFHLLSWKHLELLSDHRALEEPGCGAERSPSANGSERADAPGAIGALALRRTERSWTLLPKYN